MDGKPLSVLVGAGFVEAAHLRWPLEPEEASYLVSPVAFYRVPGRAIPLPYDLDSAGAAYLQQVSAMLADEGEPFVLVMNTHRFFQDASVPFQEWLEQALRPRGFSSRSVAEFGDMSIIVFERARRESERIPPARRHLARQQHMLWAADASHLAKTVAVTETRITLGLRRYPCPRSAEQVNRQTVRGGPVTPGAPMSSATAGLALFAAGPPACSGPPSNVVPARTRVSLSTSRCAHTDLHRLASRCYPG